jgi:hypothetical protein
MYSSHSARQLVIQTEITAGVIGPLALAKQLTGNVSLSVIQKELSPLIHQVVDQTIGNISITVSW